jgi:hypothetical protein
MPTEATDRPARRFEGRVVLIAGAGTNGEQALRFIVPVAFSVPSGGTGSAGSPLAVRHGAAPTWPGSTARTHG